MHKFGMGQPVTRKEDVRFLTGTGRYTDDINLNGQAYAFVLRSPHAHADIDGIDTTAAKSAPGVLGVYTADDLSGLGTDMCLIKITSRDGTENVAPPHPLLTGSRVRRVGDPVALVVAESLVQAREAADLIEVNYDPLPAIVDTAGAMAPGAPQVWDEAPNNLCFDWENGDSAATEAAFGQAAHITTIDLTNNRLVANPMESRVAIGDYDKAADAYTVHLTTQGAHFLAFMLSALVFNQPIEKFRVITPDVGGGFGAKVFLYAEYALVLWASKQLGRAVKWTSTRNEGFVSDTQGRDHVTHGELAFDEAGRILAFRSETTCGLGAYLSNLGAFIPTGASQGMQVSVYAFPAAYVSVKGVFTNTVSVDAYRGAGRPEATYVMERLLDKAAGELGKTPAELRGINYIKPDQMPFTTSLGLTYDSGEFERNTEEACELANLAGFPARRSAAQAVGKCRGIGMAYYIENCAGPEVPTEEVTLRFEPDQTISIFVGTQSNGQGHETTFAQMAADRLGILIDKIEIRQGDSAFRVTGGGTAASRSMLIGGSAVRNAAENVVEKAQALAAELLEAAPADLAFSDGAYTVVGTDRRIDLFDVAAAVRDGKVGDGGALEGVGSFTSEVHTFPNGCHVCEVEIDPDTGALEIVNFVVVDDFGKVVNPLLVAGQVHGGIAQGVGQALMEHAIYDDDSGQLLTATFMDYGMPRALDMPPLETKWNEIPCRTNPLGIKGAGEAGAVGSPPAIVNAIVDALSGYGVTHIDMPVTPERIWRAINGS